MESNATAYQVEDVPFLVSFVTEKKKRREKKRKDRKVEKVQTPHRISADVDTGKRDFFRPQSHDSSHNFSSQETKNNVRKRV